MATTTKGTSTRWMFAALLAVACTGCESCTGCEHDWPAYRFGGLREANQRDSTPVSDVAKVPGLAVRWTFPTAGPEGGSFYASPIVVDGRVFIGSTSGRFYALDAKSGGVLWTYPPTNQPPLLGTCAGGGGTQTFGRYGVMSSAVYTDGLVVFGAPDPSAETGLGSARLFAVHAKSGALAWASDVVAHVSGCTPSATGELHERIAYSAPLVFKDKIYVGIHDAGDDPIQNGRVAAVDADSGHLVSGFSYTSTSTRGGGVWNAPASDRTGVFFTTGNTRCDGAGCQNTEPSPNRGLSMVRVDPATGAVAWQFQPVPYDLDDDPDWSAGVTVMSTRCGTMVASVEKDGWAYALDSATGACRWQFPPTAPTSPPAAACKFAPGGAHDHGDTDYKRPGAAWGDVLVINTGGEALPQSGVGAGYGRLHALNACATSEAERVRWIADVPNASGSGYSIGAPTVSRGIFYVTTDLGHVIALADPATGVAPAGYRCSNVDFTLATCAGMGFSVVPAPAVLADVALPDGSSAAGMRNEVAIAGGRVFAATLGGHVYMLSP
jgi:outer membrane protein assembly factor BamB